LLKTTLPPIKTSKELGRPSKPETSMLLQAFSSASFNVRKRP